MIYFLLILAVLAPFVALRIAEARLSRLNDGAMSQAAALHHLANSLTAVGNSLGEGLRRFGSSFPASLTLRHQHETILPTPSGTDEEPIPADVEAYLQGWNDQWARDDELRYLRGLKTKLGSWDIALKTVLSGNRG